MITFEEEKDMMTFEEAKDVFLNHGWIKIEGGTYFDGSKWREAIMVLSDYLQREPCEDTISRQAVLEYIQGSEAELGHDSENELVCQDIKALPSVTTQAKVGYWILHQNYNSDGLGFEYFSCSECDDRNDEKSRYCPNCGAKMQEVVEE